MNNCGSILCKLKNPSGLTATLIRPEVSVGGIDTKHRCLRDLSASGGGESRPNASGSIRSGDKTKLGQSPVDRQWGHHKKAWDYPSTCNFIKLRAHAKPDVAPMHADRAAPQEPVCLSGRHNRTIAIRGSRPQHLPANNPDAFFFPASVLRLCRYRACRARPRSSTRWSFHAALHYMAYPVEIRTYRPHAVSDAISFSGMSCRAPGRVSVG